MAIEIYGLLTLILGKQKALSKMKPRYGTNILLAFMHLHELRDKMFMFLSAASWLSHVGLMLLAFVIK